MERSDLFQGPSAFRVDELHLGYYSKSMSNAASITIMVATIYDVDTGYEIRDATPAELADYNRNFPMHQGQIRGERYGLDAYRRVYLGDMRQEKL